MATLQQIVGRGEQVLYVTRQHILVLISHMLTATMLIAVLITAGFFSQRAFTNQESVQFQGMNLNVDYLLIVLGLICLWTVVSMFATFLRWNAEQCMVTDRRLMHRSGILTHNVDDIPLDTITEIIPHQTWLGRIFNFGTVDVYTPNATNSITLENIADPARLKQALLDAQHSYEQGYGYLDAPALLTLPDIRSADSDVQHALEDLARLRDRGIVSREEFEQKKRELLTQIEAH
jgi:membrane protein YdbS with pleckstrin-like domain